MLVFVPCTEVCARQTCKLNNNKAKHRRTTSIHNCSPVPSGAFLSTFHTFNSPFKRRPFFRKAEWQGGKWNWSPSRMLINIDWFLIVSPIWASCWSMKAETFFEAQFQFRLRVGRGKKGWTSVWKMLSDVSFMCYGDIQQMIEVEWRDTTLDPWLSDKDKDSKEILPRILFRLSCEWDSTTTKHFNGIWCELAQCVLTNKNCSELFRTYSCKTFWGNLWSDVWESSIVQASTFPAPIEHE